MNHEEMQYLDILQDCIEQTELNQDRTGIGTYGVIGKSMRFSLKDNKIPVFTTKKVFWRGVAEELLWFISGETDSKILHDKKIGIWDGNTTREFLDNNNLHNVPEFDIGTGYGFQWRNWGGDYRIWKEKGLRTGIDQFFFLLEEIRNNPSSRRLILSSWNVSQLKTMALPPCHCFAQFFVRNKKLSCIMYQRSCDLFLGVPFNIASYSLLTHMIAKECGLEAHEFIWNGGDVHLYSNHIDQAKIQVKRTPYEFPTVTISDDKSIFNIKYDDIKLHNYQSHETIKADMAI